MFAITLSLVACDEGGGEGEAKTPSRSSDLAGKHYEEVISIFKERGFSNIKTEPIDDLIFGWLTKDGEVEDVSINGNVEYSPGKWISNDAEIIIRYHTFPSTDENDTNDSVVNNTPSKSPSSTNPETQEKPMTVKTSSDLANLLSIRDPLDPFVKEFARKYKGKTIEFDGNIAFMSNHGSYKTRYDILIYAGDYSETTALGPSFQFVDVNIHDLNLVGNNIPDSLHTGHNLHIVAKVVGYNESSGLFELKPISTKVR